MHNGLRDMELSHYLQIWPPDKKPNDILMPRICYSSIHTPLPLCALCDQSKAIKDTIHNTVTFAWATRPHSWVPYAWRTKWSTPEGPSARSLLDLKYIHIFQCDVFLRLQEFHQELHQQKRGNSDIVVISWNAKNSHWSQKGSQASWYKVQRVSLIFIIFETKTNIININHMVLNMFIYEYNIIIRSTNFRYEFLATAWWIYWRLHHINGNTTGTFISASASKWHWIAFLWKSVEVLPTVF